MLRISIIESPSQRRLVLEGKLIAPWASELRTECSKAQQELQGRNLIIDMKNLITISQEGEKVLLELMNEGVKFRGCGVFTKHILNQLARRIRKDLREANQ
jgi:anti-anti-sigma regulatory factor